MQATMTTEKREWVFFRNFGGYWCWEMRVNGSTARESRREFSTREECVADATTHGFRCEPSVRRDDSAHPKH